MAKLRTLNALVKEARRRRHLTLRKVADLARISLAYVHNLEQAERVHPSSDMLARLCVVLDLDYDLVCFLAGAWPNDLRDARQLYPALTEERLAEAFRAFRAVLLRPGA